MFEPEKPLILDRKTGVILFAEGSTREEANQSVWKVAAVVGACSDFDFVRPAFLETAKPDLAETVAEAVGLSIERLLVVPYYVIFNPRVQEQLPQLIAAASRRHSQLDIRLTAPLEGHPLLAEIILERTRQLLRSISPPPA